MFCEVQAASEIQLDEDWQEFRGYIELALPGAFSGQGGIDYQNIKMVMDIMGIEQKLRHELLWMTNLYLSALRQNVDKSNKKLRQAHGK